MNRVAVLLVLAACAPRHVTIAPPAPTLSPDQRVQYFMANEPTKTDSYFVSYDGGPKELTGQVLVLANRTEVDAPEDLLPLVGPDTATARAARAAVDARRSRLVAIVTYYGLAAATLLSFDRRRDVVGVDHTYVTGGLAVGALLGYLVERHYRYEENQQRAVAFSAYTRDLGDRLNVCAHGLQVIACEVPLPP
ncbi:MAG TPA: hypothetical protein VGM90_06505 [Kofleriaceae bacterium]|jgi:hypothetical protein